MHEGQASVYLRTGQFLRLAVLSGDGTILEDLPVTNQVLEGGQEDIAFLSTENLTLKGNLTNTLSPTDWLSNAQLQQDDALYYFQANSNISIEASGSCALTNTLKWVPVDLDPVTGERSVGGVITADTDEFRDALRKNALKDFAITGGGTGDKFDITQTLTIPDSASGYYAPFLETSQGNTFFIGTTANPDNLSHFRLFGNAIFGIEDLPSTNMSDFDFNDMVVRITPL
jgi:hypothetical protein